jgi:predicted nucleotidyltransferase
MTGDVDVTVEAGEGGALGLVDHLARAGFDLRIDLDESFLREARLLPLVHRSTGMPVDVVIAVSELHGELLDRRRLVDVGGVRVPLISPEDLVVTKILAGRPKDIEDVRGVLLEQEGLDVARIRELLGELEAALEDTRLLRRFERVFGKARGRPAR